MVRYMQVSSRVDTFEQASGDNKQLQEIINSFRR